MKRMIDETSDPSHMCNRLFYFRKIQEKISLDLYLVVSVNSVSITALIVNAV